LPAAYIGPVRIPKIKLAAMSRINAVFFKLERFICFSSFCYNRHRLNEVNGCATLTPLKFIKVLSIDTG
jgi:hypothetical protein